MGAEEIVGGGAGSGQPPGQDRSGVTTGGQGVESGQSTTDLVPDASSASSVRSDSPATSVRAGEGRFMKGVFPKRHGEDTVALDDPTCAFCDDPLSGGPGGWWSKRTVMERCVKSMTGFHEARK